MSIRDDLDRLEEAMKTYGFKPKARRLDFGVLSMRYGWDSVVELNVMQGLRVPVLEWIRVPPDERKRGEGRRIMTSLTLALKEAGCEGLKLVVGDTEVAVGFWRSWLGRDVNEMEVVTIPLGVKENPLPERFTFPDIDQLVRDAQGTFTREEVEDFVDYCVRAMQSVPSHPEYVEAAWVKGQGLRPRNHNKLWLKSGEIAVTRRMDPERSMRASVMGGYAPGGEDELPPEGREAIDAWRNARGWEENWRPLNAANRETWEAVDEEQRERYSGDLVAWFDFVEPAPWEHRENPGAPSVQLAVVPVRRRRRV